MEVKALLKSLCAEQVEGTNKKSVNDCVAFLQSGRCDDHVRLVSEQEVYMSQG